MIEALSTLKAGAAELGLDLSLTQLDQLMAYLALIQKWNKVYNLTAVRDPQEMLTHHLLDSLTAIAPLVRHTQGQPAKVLDVGSGGGLPGIVLAICLPELDVSCVDTVGKKAAFIQQVAATLKLPHLRGIHARVETLTGPFDVICCRAFASLPDFVSWSRGALAEQGVWMAMKGKHPQTDIDGLPADVNVFHVEPLAVPGLDVERCMVWLKPLAVV
jgi:16S rRNA (guanine527-N7)-methyltransferase